MRIRKEVIWCARALQYITEAVITREEDFFEEMVINTYRILCHDVNHSKYKRSWRSYAQDIELSSSLLLLSDLSFPQLTEGISRCQIANINRSVPSSSLGPSL